MRAWLQSLRLARRSRRHYVRLKVTPMETQVLQKAGLILQHKGALFMIILHMQLPSFDLSLRPYDYILLGPLLRGKLPL